MMRPLSSLALAVWLGCATSVALAETTAAEQDEQAAEPPTRKQAFELYASAQASHTFALQLQADREHELDEAKEQEAAAALEVSEAGSELLEVEAKIATLRSVIAELRPIESAANALAQRQADLVAAEAEQAAAEQRLALLEKVAADAKANVATKQARLDAAKGVVEAAEKAEQHAKDELDKFDRRYQHLANELEASRELRCKTALCWGENGTEYAIEPVLDLPVGIVWSFGKGALTSYINANKLNIEFNAGLRMWMWHDRFSVLVYFAEPIVGSEDKIRLEGSSFEHPTTSVHRPFPSIGFGFFGDILQIGLAYDVLVNGDSASDRDPSYRPNQVLSRSLTITIGIATVLTARTALAAGNAEKDESEEDE